MTVIRRPQQQRRGVHSPTCDDDDAARVFLANAISIDDHPTDFASVTIRLQTQNLCVSDQGNILMPECGIDADRLSIRLSANQTRMTVACVAANAETLPRVLLVDPDPQRNMKRP